MREQFSGTLGASPMAAPDAQSAITQITLDRASLRFVEPLQSIRVGDDLCMAIGEPRFDDAKLQSIHASEGAAAAWYHGLKAREFKTPPFVRGRFAVILIRNGGRAAMCITDRFATWPICFSQTDGKLHFSDRADCVPKQGKSISRQAIFDYIFLHMIPAPTTIFEGVSRLPAGHVLHWTPDTLTTTPWWQPHFDINTRADFKTAQAQFLQIIEDGVARETTDASVGCFLSGGTDSSTVTGMLCKVSGQPARSYSIGFDASGYDEMEYARLAARHFGADHREYYVTPADLLDGIPKVATHYDQPFGNSSAVPAWICASRARDDGIDKLLAGDGGDELFGGNTRYAKQRVFGLYDHLPAALRHHLMEPILGRPVMERIPLVRKAASYVEQAKVPMPDRMDMYNMLYRLGIDNVFEDDFLAQIDPGHPSVLHGETWRSIERAHPINRMLAFDWKYTLADNDLPKVIGTTQLAGVNVAFPLLSDELVDFSMTLPTEWKLKGLTLRWFFKEALRGFLPDAIITKKKHGFGLPFGVWACEHEGLRQLTRDALSSFRERKIVRTSFIDELLDTHLPAHPGYYGEMAWILMMMEFWLREHE